MRKRKTRTIAFGVLIFVFSIATIALSMYLDLLIIHSDLPGWLKYR